MANIQNLYHNTSFSSDKDGNVGIGTTSPSTPLHVNGIVRIDTSSDTAFYEGASVRVFGTQAYGFRNSGGAYIANISMSGNSYFNGGNVGIGTTSPGESLEILKDGGAIIKLHDPGNNSWKIKADSNFHIYDDSNSDYLTILNSGNVGIGTTAPVAKLDVLGTSGGPTVFDYAYATSAGLRIHGDESAMDIVGTDSGNHASTILLRNGNEGFGLLNNPNLNTLQFRSFTATADGFNIHDTGSGLSSLVDIITLEKTGNVGIGTTSPNEKLQLKGNGTYISVIASDNSNAVKLGTDSSGDGLLQLYSDAGVNNIKLYGEAASPSYINAGNVGIGTTSPNTKLHVAGYVRATSGVYFNSTSTVGFKIENDSSNNELDIYGGSLVPGITIDNSGHLTLGNYGLSGSGTPVKFLGLDSNSKVVTYTSGGSLPGGPYLPLAGGNLSGPVVSTSSIQASSFYDGYITWNAAQLNRYGAAIELQYTPTNAGTFVKIGANGSNPTTFNAFTGEAVFTGDVGIGTTSPGAKLHVAKVGFPQVRINDETNQGESGIRFRSFDGVSNGVHGDIFVDGAGGNEVGRMGFRIPWNGTEKMTILSSGNVGIGTTSPDTSLDVEGAIQASESGGDFIRMQTDGTNNIFDVNSGDYVFRTSGFAERMRITSGGNVGIGTTTPSAKLSVIGDIDFGGGNNNGIIEVSGSGDLIFKYKGSDPALTLDGGAVKTIVHNRLDALNIVNINNPSNNESILNIRDDDSSSNGHIAFENSSEVTGIVSSGTDFINFRAGDGVAITDSPMLTLFPNRIGINTTSPNSNVALDIDGRVLIKDSTGVADFYLGNYATANHFRFHTNNANTYFDMNCGNIYWRDGASTRYTFFPSTANMTVNGTITQNSDARVKENVVEISNCISKVQAMKGVYYNRTDFNTEVTKVGVIAQDVEAVLPELIIESPEDGLKSVAYSELTAVLINAIKEQQEIIEDLKTRITKLEN